MIQGQVFMALPRGSDACALSHYPGDFGVCISRCINLMLADSCWAWLNDKPGIHHIAQQRPQFSVG